MASLRSKILDNRFRIELDLPAELVEMQKLTATLTYRRLESRQVILVNAQKVYESVRAAVLADGIRMDWREAFPRPKPPFREMWIESLQTFETERVRVGILLITLPIDEMPEGWENTCDEIQERVAQDHPTEIVNGLIWLDAHGLPTCAGKITYWTDQEGEFQYSFRQPGMCWHRNKGTDTTVLQRGFLRCQQLWLLATLARLNCHNVELRPMEAGQARQLRRSHSRPPASVWHEIVVKPSPLVKRARAQDPAEAEKHAVRLHKVRGHFADYRAGAGLFGKWKVLIWVEEHEAGEAEQGTVVSSYRVE